MAISALSFALGCFNNNFQIHFLTTVAFSPRFLCWLPRSFSAASIALCICHLQLHLSHFKHSQTYYLLSLQLKMWMGLCSIHRQHRYSYVYYARDQKGSSDATRYKHTPNDFYIGRSDLPTLSFPSWGTLCMGSPVLLIYHCNPQRRFALVKFSQINQIGLYQLKLYQRVSN